MNKEHQPRYVLESWPHGWLMCAAPGQTGVPITAMSETASIAGWDMLVQSQPAARTSFLQKL